MMEEHGLENFNHIIVTEKLMRIGKSMASEKSIQKQIELMKDLKGSDL